MVVCCHHMVSLGQSTTWRSPSLHLSGLLIKQGFYYTLLSPTSFFGCFLNQWKRKMVLDLLNPEPFLCSHCPTDPFTFPNADDQGITDGASVRAISHTEKVAHTRPKPRDPCSGAGVFSRLLLNVVEEHSKAWIPIFLVVNCVLSLQ